MDNKDLKYQYLGEFDREMLALIKQYPVLSDTAMKSLWIDQDRKIIAFEKGGLVFLFNFHPTGSFADFYLPIPEMGRYQTIFDSDEAVFGGHGRVDHNYIYEAQKNDQNGQGFCIYAPNRTAIVLKKVD